MKIYYLKVMEVRSPIQASEHSGQTRRDEGEHSEMKGSTQRSEGAFRDQREHSEMGEGAL